MYLVKDRRNGQVYALKRSALMLPEHETRFQNEVDAHGSMASCPFVVTLVDSKVVTLKDGGKHGILLLPFYFNGSVSIHTE